MTNIFLIGKITIFFIVELKKNTRIVEKKKKQISQNKTNPTNIFVYIKKTFLKI